MILINSFDQDGDCSPGSPPPSNPKNLNDIVIIPTIIRILIPLIIALLNSPK